VIDRAARIQDLLANNGVAPGEQLTLAAFRHLPAIRRRAQALLVPNLKRVSNYLEREPRLSAHLPVAGNIVFAKVLGGINPDRLANRLRATYSTLIVPGRFFEATDFIRFSFGMRPSRLARGLRNLSDALEDLS
jgi:DNA-binding transcriptional MocR family regulator